MKNRYVYVVIMLLFFACTSKTNKRISGDWSVDIDSSQVLNRDWNIVGNIINLDGDYCILPRIFNNELEDDKGEWFLNSTEDTVFFDVPKNPLYGRYKVKFYKDYDNLKFKMKLSNDSTVLICSKSIICSSASAKEYLKDY